MIRLRLREFLDEHEISAYRLGLSVPELDAQTIYHYVRGSRTPSLKGLDAVIRGLRNLTDKPVDISDLLQYIDDAELARTPAEEVARWTLIPNDNDLTPNSKATIAGASDEKRGRFKKLRRFRGRFKRRTKRFARYLFRTLTRARVNQAS